MRITFLFTVAFLYNATFAQIAGDSNLINRDTASAESSKSVFNSLRPITISYELVTWFDVGDFYHESLLKNSDSWFNWFNDNSETNSGVELLATIPWTGNSNKSNFVCGLGYEWIRNEIGGSMDVEYYETHGWLDFTPNEFGEKLTLNHRVNIYSLITGYRARTFPMRNLVGTGITIFLPVRFYNIFEKENVEMQGNYHVFQTPDGDYLYYESDFFSRENRAVNATIKPGVRLDLYFGKHFSLILPEINYEFTVYSQEMKGIEYFSSVDDDVLVIPARKHKLNTVTITFGGSLHL